MDETLASGPFSFLPEIGCEEVTADFEFALLASDGLFEKASSEQVMLYARKRLLQTNDVDLVAKEVVNQFVHTDNTSVVLLVFKG